MDVKIRRAILDDRAWLINQIRAFEVFAGYKRSLMEDAEIAFATLTGIIESHIVFIAYNCVSDERLGFIAGHAASHPFNQNLRVLTELFWWVAPEHRGGSAAAMLLNEFEKIGRENFDWVAFSLEHNSPVRDQHLIARGFRQVERTYLLEV